MTDQVLIRARGRDGQIWTGRLIGDGFAGGSPRGTVTVYFEDLEKLRKIPPTTRWTSGTLEFDACTGLMNIWGQGMDENTDVLVLLPGDLMIARGKGWIPPKHLCAQSGAPVARGNTVNCSCGSTLLLEPGSKYIPRHGPRREQ